MLRAILRFLIPLRAIAAELRTMRRLMEAVAAQHLNVTLPDERLLAKTPKADGVEISYDVKQPKSEQEEWDERYEEGVSGIEMEDLLR